MEAFQNQAGPGRQQPRSSPGLSHSHWYLCSAQPWTLKKVSKEASNKCCVLFVLWTKICLTVYSGPSTPRVLYISVNAPSGPLIQCSVSHHYWKPSTSKCTPTLMNPCLVHVLQCCGRCWAAHRGVVGNHHWFRSNRRVREGEAEWQSPIE